MRVRGENLVALETGQCDSTSRRSVPCPGFYLPYRGVVENGMKC